ncbi:alpha/beta fold hydrolase [Micromonospora sp. NPDC006431]|uniref:alpha/beta fold hydrolase n=1 Tax=Micromonospora sp. NPDC006431 TaxID=3364235 RepID=UPI0036CBD775
MRLLPTPAAVNDVRTDFGSVRVYRFGSAEGTPIVLLHGRNGTTVSWRPNIAALAERRRVYSVDLLGEPGASVQTAAIRDAQDQAAWLDGALAGLRLDAAHVVGVSIGGWLACNYAVRRPERVASLSLLDPANTFARLPIGVVLRTIPTLLPIVSTWARPRFLRWVDGQGSDPGADPVGRVIDAAMRCYRPALPQPGYFTDEQLRSLAMPVLAVVAGRSVMHDPAQAHRRARRLIGNGQVELWPDATHAISGQYADKINARILRFVQQPG